MVLRVVRALARICLNKYLVYKIVCGFQRDNSRQDNDLVSNAVKLMKKIIF